MHEVDRVDSHPNYDRRMYDYDAAIVTLKTRIKIDQFRQPIELPFQNEALVAGSKVSTIGWGFTQNMSDSEALLRKVELTVSIQLECFKAYQNDGGVTTRMVCASGPGKDSCSGGNFLSSTRSK